MFGRRIQAITVLAVMGAATAMADVPREMTFQGKLTGNGTGPVNLVVKFWDAPTGGNLLWSETHDNVPRSGGLFSVNIGSQTSGGIPDQALDYKAQDPNSPGVWLGITVGDPIGAELTPRTKVGMVAFASKSSRAEQLTIPGTFDNAVTVGSDGKVGIGVGSAPSKLTVYGTDADGWNSGIELQREDGGMARIQVDTQGLKFRTWSASDNFYFQNSENATVLFLQDGGAVGVNTPNAPSRLTVCGNSAEGWTGGLELQRDDGGMARIAVDTEGLKFRTWRDGAAFHFRNAANNTTLYIDAIGRVGMGTTSPQTKLDVEGTIRGSVVQITGGSDLAEPFAVANSDESDCNIEPGLVVSIDSANPGKLILATEAYDRKVAGVISGAGGVQPGMIMKQDAHPTAEGEHPIAMAGRVYVWCDADAGGPITPGDRLTTSSTPGHAMKVTNNDKGIGAVIGKAMMELKQGKGLVLMLVQPQ